MIYKGHKTHCKHIPQLLGLYQVLLGSEMLQATPKCFKGSKILAEEMLQLRIVCQSHIPSDLPSTNIYK